MARALTLRLTASREWLELVAYRTALQAIVEEADADPWQENEAADIARTVLEAFEEED